MTWGIVALAYYAVAVVLSYLILKGPLHGDAAWWKVTLFSVVMLCWLPFLLAVLVWEGCRWVWRTVTG